METNRKFTVEYLVTDTKEKKTVECEIRQPTIPEMDEANKVYRVAFTKALKEKSLLRAKLRDFMREQELWDDEKEAELQTLRKNLSQGEKTLAMGGIKLSEMKQVCLNMRKWRSELRDLLMVQSDIDKVTAESQAEDTQFEYMVATCTYYVDGEKVWKTVDEYRRPEIPEIAIRAAMRFASLQHGVDENFEESLPENKLLKKYKFVDEQLRLINKDGKLVDFDERLIDEWGNYIDEEGKRVDIDGNRVDEDGRLVVDSKPFLDDEGNPIIDKEVEEIDRSVDKEELGENVEKDSNEVESNKTTE